MPEEGAPEGHAFSFPSREKGPVRTYEEEMVHLKFWSTYYYIIIILCIQLGIHIPNKWL